MNRTKSEYTYWDASVFLAYLNNEPGRADTIDALIDQVSRARTARLVTSALTIVEVVTAANSARPQRLTTTQDDRIDELLTAPFLRLVDTSLALYYDARRLMRAALDRGWSLKAKDAIHLATAAWLHQAISPLLAIHTYDDKWLRYSHLVGGLPITPPYLPQPPLPFAGSE